MAKLTVEQANKVYDCPIDDLVLAAMIKRRSEAADKLPDKLKLADLRQANQDIYLTKYANDKNPEEAIFADNRIFVAIRSITPYLTARLTQPEVTAAEGSDLGLQFAKDFERIIVQLAEDEKAKHKLRLAAQDLLKGQRIGVVKWGYDPTRNKLTLKRVDPAKFKVDGDTDMFEEPNFCQETIPMVVADILAKFPQKEADIINWMGLATKLGGPERYQALEEIKDITESWTFITDENGDRRLTCVFKYKENVLGAMGDPLYKVGATNLIPEPMMPYIWFNFLNDGNSKYDETSYLEQAQWSQRNYDRLGQAITDNSTFGTSGVPVFAKDGLDVDDVDKVKFRPNKRIVIDLKKAGVNTIEGAFTTWSAAPVQQYVIDDKSDNRNNVDNTFGTPSIFRGEKTDSNTLGQDAMLRDQSEGRLQEPVDYIDLAMQRFFLIEAQHIFRYFTGDDYYRFIGDDGNFEQVMLSNVKLRENAGLTIRIQGGTNLPVDRNQKIATVVKLLELEKAPTLESYKILGVFDDPDKAYKEYLEELADPAAALADADKEMFDREAYEDIYAVIGGKVPEEQEDITPEYVQFITDWLNTDKFRLLTPAQQQSVTHFAQMVQAKAQLKLAKLESQQPVPSPGTAVGPDGQPLPPGAPAGPGQDPNQPPGPPPPPDGPAAPPQPQAPAQPPGLTMPPAALAAIGATTQP